MPFPAFAMALWVIMLIAGIFDAASTASASSLGTSTSNLNILVENEPLNTRGIPGVDSLQIPAPNPSLISTTAKILTWDLSFFKEDFNMIRWFMLALTYGFTIAAFGLIPVFIQLAEFSGKVIGGIVGIVGSGIKSLLRV